MKEYISMAAANNRARSPELRKESNIFSAISVILYVLGGFSFFAFIYLLCNAVGSIVSGSPGAALTQVIYTFPEMTILLLTTFLSFIVHQASRPTDLASRNRHIFVNGILVTVAGALTAIYTIIGYCTGLYAKFIIGYPTFLFPFDMILFGILFVLVGLGMSFYKKKYFEKHLTALPLRKDDRKKVTKVFDSIFFMVGYCLSVFAFGGFVYGFWYIDWTHGHVFFSVMQMAVYLVSILMVIFFKFVYLPLKEEDKNECLRKAGLAGFIINLVIFALYMVASLLDPMASTDACAGILPIEFTASVNAGEILYGIFLLAAPLTAFIKGLIHKGK